MEKVQRFKYQRLNQILHLVICQQHLLLTVFFSSPISWRHFLSYVHCRPNETRPKVQSTASTLERCVQYRCKNKIISRSFCDRTESIWQCHLQKLMGEHQYCEFFVSTDHVVIRIGSRSSTHQGREIEHRWFGGEVPSHSSRFPNLGCFHKREPTQITILGVGILMVRSAIG